MGLGPKSKMAEDLQADVVPSLYESCINTISCALTLINVNYLKDFPNHLLEEIISNFNPLVLESIENADFLPVTGISTESLWKTHYSNRWKHIMVKYSSTQKVNAHGSWRALYFQRHFHELLNRLACSKDNNSKKILQDSTQELYKKHQRQLRCSTNKRNASLESIDGMIDLCLKHLNQLRLYNATCRFLDRHRDVLMRFARSIVHLEIHGLRDNGVESLSKILPFLFALKLTSFALLSSRVQSEDNVRILLASLSKSTSANSSITYETDHGCEGGVEEALLSGDPEFRMRTEVSLDKSSLTGDLCNKDDCPVPFEHRAANENCWNYEDDLYDDIFSGNFNFDDECKTTDMISNSFQATRDHLWSPKNHVELHSCLTELELFSCLMEPAALKLLAQALVNFCNLHTLKLVDTGSGNSWQMNDVINSIHGLVMKGSLRHLVIENSTINDCHGIIFSEMLVGSCQKCCARSSKGLSSLRLVANGLGKATAHCMARKLTSCSNCEDHNDFAWCRTNKNIEHAYCSDCFLGENVLTPAPETGSPGTSTATTSEGMSYVNDCAGKDDDDGDYCSGLRKVCETKRTLSNLKSTNDHVISNGIEFLYLQSVGMASGGATAIAQSLLRNRSLHSLLLPWCGLHTHDIAAIFNCIAGCGKHESNHAIKKLDLRENSYEASADGSLFNLISRSQLVHLDLSFCGLEVIPDDVISALSCNNTLEVLKIAGNRLGDKGGTAISNVFKSKEKKSMLMTLDLSYNRLTTSSLIHLGQVLTTWPRKLREISVMGNLLDRPLEDLETCLARVFDAVIITEQFVDNSMVYVDYVSVM